MGWFCKKTNKSELSIAIETLAASPSVENQKNFASIISAYVENGTWVPMPIHQDKKGYRLKIIESRGKHYAAMCSDESEVRKDSEFNVLVTDINKLIEPVFQNEHIDGIVINPYTKVLCLDKEFLLKCLLHANYPEQRIMGSHPRNWGEGIPSYNKNDLMTQGEIQNFALHTVLDNDKNITDNFDIVSVCDYPNAMPSIILQSQNAFAFVYVKGYSALTEPVLSEQEKNELLLLGKKYNAETYFTTVGFLSTDPVRFEAELALRGDGFYCKYEGLQKVE